MADDVVHFEKVRKTFRLRNRSDSLRDAIPRLARRILGRTGGVQQPFVALDGVTFSVGKGEALGLVGANGAGKSTALRLSAGVYAPDGGVVSVNGRVAAMIELSAGFHPDLSGRENIYLAGALLGLRRREVEGVFGAIVDFADIGEFLDSPVRVYSSGMAVRLGFSVAAHVPAEVLLIDEVLAVGDLDFQDRCLRRMAQRRSEGVSILFVSHNLTVVEQFCDRVLLLQHGSVVADGPPREAVAEYRRRMAEQTGRSDLRRAGVPAGNPRHGTGEVRLDEVRFGGDDGLPPGSVRSGGRLVVTASWRAAAPYENPVLGLAIHTMEGALCSETSSAGTPLGRLEGSGTLRVEMDPLLLLPGEYELSVFAKDASGLLPLDMHYRLYPLRVLGTPTAGERGVLSLRPRWDVRRNGA
jgi:ABC-type polysaccharide/polyol phosphate transport system ATPase subunit